MFPNNYFEFGLGHYQRHRIRLLIPDVIQAISEAEVESTHVLDILDT